MTDFDCTAYARWLDEGGADPAIAARAAAHAAACGPCAAAAAGERALVALLRGPAITATAPDFADRVMARVALTPQDAAAATFAPARVAADVFPWWIRATAQPASVLALGLAGLVSAFTPQLLGASHDAPRWSAAAWTILAGPLASIAGRDPLTGAVVALALLPLVVVVSLGFYCLGAKLTTAHFAPPQVVRADHDRA